MKNRAIILAVAVVAIVFTGCAKKPEPVKETKADVVTSASITNDPEVLVKAMSKDGNWIMGIKENMTTDKELVLEGDNFTKPDKKDPTKKVPAIKRQLILLARDDKKVTTANYILTAKKLTIKSGKSMIEGGTFKGDVYIETEGFSLEASTIDGNIYFANEKVQKSFKMDDKSQVTGKQEIKK